MNAATLSLQDHRPIQAMLNLVVVLGLILSTLAPVLSLQSRSHFPPAITQRQEAVASGAITAFDGPSPTLAANAARTHGTRVVGPSFWQGHPEVMARRQANVRHYQLGDDRNVAIVGGETGVYDAASGQWRAFDQRIRAVEGGYSYEQAGLSVRFGAETSTALLRNGEALFGWQPQTVVALNRQGEAIETLATVTDPALTATAATLSQEGHVLTYAGHWSDNGLTETFEAVDSGVEQSLIFAAPPTLAAADTRLGAIRQRLPAAAGGLQPAWLAFETDLFLFSGDSLWVDGRRQIDSFSTQKSEADHITIRNAAGETLLTFAPVIAYEAVDRSQQVLGHYEADLLEENIWRLRVVTPWSWWTDAARAYPAVLDPLIYVAVVNPVTVTLQDECAIEPEAGPFGGCLYNAPNEPVDHVRVTTGAYFEDNEDGYPAHMSSLEIQSTVIFNSFPTLPSGSDVQDAELILIGETVGSEFELEVVDAASGSPLQQFTLQSAEPGQTITQTVPLPAGQITPLIEGWRAGEENQGLIIRPRNISAAALCDSVTQQAKPEFHLGCGFYGTSGPQLLIEYNDPSLFSELRLDGQSMPSVDEDFDNTHHEYKLVNMPQQWHGVALIDNAPSGLSRLDIHGVDSQYDGEKANYVVYDNRNQEQDMQLPVEVHPRPDGSDNGTYSLFPDNAHPSALPMPSPIWQTTIVNLNPGAPLHLYSFDFPGGSNLGVQITVPPEATSQPELFRPRPGSNDAIGSGEWTARRGDGKSPNASEPDAQGNARFWLQVDAASPVDEHWLLALPFDEINPNCPTGESVPGFGDCAPIPVVIEMLACPRGEYPTLRWGCQPLVYPHKSQGGGIIVNPGNSIENDGEAQEISAAAVGAVSLPQTPTHDAGNVRIFNQGGFTRGAAPESIYGRDNQNRLYAICTKDEYLGMPLLGTTADVIPFNSNNPPAQRLIAVQQGSVCVTVDGVVEAIGGFGVPPYADADQEFGAIVAPSIHENSARPVRIYEEIYGEEVSLFQGKLDISDGVDGGAEFGSIHEGKMRQSGGNEFRLNPIEGGAHISIDPWQGWVGIVSGARYIEIDERSATGNDSGTLQVAPGTTGAATPVDVDSFWRRRAALVDYEFELAASILPPTMSVASLETRFHAAGQPIAHTQKAEVKEIHLTDATIHQAANMGGAYRPLQAVIRKPNKAPSCGLDRACLDLRNANNIDNPSWKMPDVDVGGPTGSVVVNAAGTLQVFSSDHPAQGIHAAGANDFSQSFNFKAFDATVSVEQAECPVNLEDNPVVTVIKGAATIGLPSLGDGAGGGETAGGLDGQTPTLAVSFTLCENQFREAMIFFDAYPPGIPAGASGMIIESLGGKVTAGEDYVQIALSLGFRSVDGATITQGGGTIVIDTRGMFRLEGGVLSEECAGDEPCISDDGEPMAALVAVFSVDGTLQVAWNPLDILIEVEVSFQDWVTGFMRMHMWRGQGWQNAYHWLPDDDAMHFTGAIGATFTIKEGRIGEFFNVTLPPEDIQISVEISFGEFCKNDGCTQYEWGVQGKVTVMSFTVGVYIGKSTGVDFFLGDKGKTLIDQAFVGAAAANAMSAVPDSLISDLGDARTLDIPKDAGGCSSDGLSDTCTFAIEPGTAQAMISVAWSEGTLPTALLHTPDGTTISAQGLVPDNVESDLAGYPVYKVEANGTVRMAYSGGSAFFTVENPQPGDWMLTLENLSGNEHYNVLFAANAPAPHLTLTSPDNVTAGANLDISWTVDPIDSEADVTLGYISNSEYMEALANHELPAATPIGAPVAANTGNFLWTIGALATGSYVIQARIDHPIHGVRYSYSPGTFRYEDTTPPAVPSGLILFNAQGSDNGLIASWNRNQDADLYAYEVIYDSPDLDAPRGLRQRTLRLLPSDRFTSSPNREQARLVGLLPSVESTVCVRAIDISGNVSACSRPATATPQGPFYSLWYEPELTHIIPGANRSMNVLWGKNGPGAPDGYMLSWARGCAAGYAGPPADQGQSNLDVGNTNNMQLTGLPAGTYRLAVRGYTTIGELKKVPVAFSRHSNSLVTVLTDGVDGDGDGLPDDWADYYGVHNAADDADGDTLTNGAELTLGTDPTRRDSDDDGYHDNDEQNLFGTSPCDTEDAPEDVPAVWLDVKTQSRESSLRFKMAANDDQSPTRRLRIRARGRGNLQYEVSADQPWIQLSKNHGGPIHWLNRFETVEVTVDPSGLAPGFYTGTVVVLGFADRPVLDAVQRIPVRFWVLHDATKLNTRIAGKVFLDDNANGIREESETTFLGGIPVNIVGEVGAVLATVVTTEGAGVFSLGGLPYAAYGLAADHPDYAVTTVHPLPVVLNAQNEAAAGLEIGLVRIEDAQDPDSDRDSVPDREEDINGDGDLSNDDSDGDGIPNARDEDDDDDGIPTREEARRNDSDGDGVRDYLDADDDGDGVPTREESRHGDTDMDGIPNYLDPDDDGDGIGTAVEGAGDSSGNGIPDYLDDTSVPQTVQIVLLPVIFR